MKKNMYLLCLLLCIGSLLKAQTLNNKEKLTAIRSVEITGYAKVELRMGEPAIATKQGKLNTYQLETRHLRIDGNNDATMPEIVLWVEAETLEQMTVSGHSIVVAYEALTFKQLHIKAFEKAILKLHLNAKDINVKVSDQASVELSGTTAYIDGASSKSAMLNLDNLNYDASYISMGQYKDYHQPIGDTVYASSGGRDIYIVDNGNAASMKYGKISIDVNENEDARVRIGSHQWVFLHDGKLRHTRYRSKAFEGHWSGLGLGINGYMHKNKFGLPKELNYMKLLWNKSINVDINIYQYSHKLAKTANLGLVTGIGLSINNYRFEHSFTVAPDSAHFHAYLNKGIGMKKSKLVLNYIQLPILLEWHDQHPSPLSKHRWHISAGLVLGWRIHTHQKTIFTERNKMFELEDPSTGDIVATATTNKRRVKIHNNFDLQPFKADATVRVGWGIINLYAQISLHHLFQSTDSPQLRPISIGIMLTN